MGSNRSSQLFLAADSLLRGANGIGRVARLMAKVLDRAYRGRVHALAFVDRQPAPGLAMTSAHFGGSRARFLLACHRASVTATHALYDFAGMARAHPRVWPLARPYLTWLHGIEAWEEAVPRRLERLRAASVLLSNSDYTRQRAGGLHRGLDHASTCWLGTEEDEPGPSTAFSGVPTALVLARIDERGGYKGHRELIAAWPDVLRAVPRARLVIAGGGPGEAFVRELARTSPARDAIDVLGFVPEERLAALWAEAWVLAMPSRGEGFGIAYIEAMRMRRPVVASIHDAAPEINLDGVTGYNVDLDRAGHLAAVLGQLLSSPSDCARLGQAGLEHWSRCFRFSAFEARFLPHLERLCGF